MAATASENNACKETKKIPRGRPKSGRIWKSEKQRKSAVIAVKQLYTHLGRKGSKLEWSAN